MALDPHRVASDWLAACSSALNRAEVDAVVQLFLPDGWLRDLLVFTWDVRSLAGREKIAAYLANTLSPAKITEVKLNEIPGLAPGAIVIPQLSGAQAVELAFTFECRQGHGRAHARLLKDANGKYRAFSLLTELSDLRGHEELSTLALRDDVTGIPGRNMQQEWRNWVEEVETKPYALIIGAGQTGLHMAARFKQMNIPALVIERNVRVGDIWRKRYPTLTLHTVKRHHTLLYQPFPTNWPEYTPRDRIADWLELYVIMQDLVVWTSAEIKGHPKYSIETKDWDVTIFREGFEVKLRPAHIVLATGTLGERNIPNVPDIDRFHGQVVHSQDYQGGAEHAGKHAVIVGAGNSSIDVCQDLVFQGAASVTMIQRSSTCVMSREYIARRQRATFLEDLPLEISDFKWASLPFGLLKKLNIATQQAAWEEDKELHDKLRKGGVKLNMGPEGEGLYLLVMERGGGYWLDKGGADLIEDGRIKVKNGVTVEKFTENGVVFSDGSQLPADVVIFATGYTNMRENNKELFGEDVIGITDEVYGLDEEGELRGSYRPSGYPGLWFASGDFYISRVMSKTLALQLKAIQLGLLKHNGRRDGQQWSGP
ncbi:dimethylaniline monooxygenase (N-oxide-forming) [Dichomitus squalens LYAD-421 SS1]|uniref:Dimethylaniline monooxygenase (N-oxide-forming) n=1 Tax=Dichomitus squalens (strain LYAD-421) TaxID=732165 RepID=R7T1X3_DICSQ|nr:dimethylaniline monooxygenase (N-oxide-forming) [Dichomitus squalens LYAD-421 SS1]EJF61137.1 dimethylaniline monooxygenase (N-oxide-forming) [Dichomitus squalens LYAD-421 SS1]